jgi:hypothetical protein
MIKIYTLRTEISQKAIKWLKEHDLECKKMEIEVF